MRCPVTKELPRRPAPDKPYEFVECQCMFEAGHAQDWHKYSTKEEQHDQV